MGFCVVRASLTASDLCNSLAILINFLVIAIFSLLSSMGSNPECMFEDPVKSYQAFYKTKQERFSMDWTKRPTPEWFTA